VGIRDAWFARRRAGEFVGTVPDVWRRSLKEYAVLLEERDYKFENHLMTVGGIIQDRSDRKHVQRLLRAAGSRKARMDDIIDWVSSHRLDNWKDIDVEDVPSKRAVTLLHFAMTNEAEWVRVMEAKAVSAKSAAEGAAFRDDKRGPEVLRSQIVELLEMKV
jgi:hypothetical protein